MKRLLPAILTALLLLGVPAAYSASGYSSVLSALNALYTLMTGAGINVTCTSGCSGGSGGTVSQEASTPVTATMQSSAVANGNGTTLNTTGMASATLTVNCATCSGGTQVNFEGTQDGTNYFPIGAMSMLSSPTIAYSTTTSGLGGWQLNVTNLTAIRARISAYSAGTVTVTGSTSPMPLNQTPAEYAQLTASVPPCSASPCATVIGQVAPAANGVGGASPGHILSAASNNSTSIKGSAGTLYSLTWLQTTTTLMDIRLYDTASAPTCGSATGVIANFVVQSNATSPGGSPNLGPTGIKFANGIGICITGANADNDNTNAVTGLNVDYAYN
jgi:hypothetical protein